MTYYEKNKDIRLNYQKQYYQENKDKIKSYTKRYYETNKEILKQKRKEKIRNRTNQRRNREGNIILNFD